MQRHQKSEMEDFKGRKMGMEMTARITRSTRVTTARAMRMADIRESQPESRRRVNLIENQVC